MVMERIPFYISKSGVRVRNEFMSHLFEQLFIGNKEIWTLQTVSVPPVSSILCESSGSYLELAYWVINIAVLKVGAYGSRLFDKKGNVSSASEAQLFVRIDPINKGIFRIPPFFGTL